ncbi:hypothetical protein K493DRAFT_87153 [Basidiobolus meristosporus CBS 931.73]|uniref:Extracellular membrane protein CFEM domain-containing protein n=1 Tax=Basidiobolus meristosporus CBS 931.73 TaxID=1314790 RepID=A0A1Y1YVM8_9FUNG|nr:hypothetical protein K493DRAFT_87153 [Basidiobolus meristosporus CBS 931.73]|eukprot:ORY02098.1 hypothetical protein K493DRAFT_87153 [Basidiobolus meristosporus CBS 931.73]
MMRGLAITLALTLFGLFPGTLCQLASSSVTSTSPLETAKPSCGAFNVMELCVRTNTEKQGGCVAFPDPRLCKCQYQHAVVTCYDLCKGDASAMGSRSRAEGDTIALCQGYNSSQIFPPQQGNSASLPSLSPSSPSRTTPGQGVTTGLSNGSLCALPRATLVALTIFFVLAKSHLV